MSSELTFRPECTSRPCGLSLKNRINPSYWTPRNDHVRHRSCVLCYNLDDCRNREPRISWKFNWRYDRDRWVHPIRIDNVQQATFGQFARLGSGLPLSGWLTSALSISEVPRR